MLSYFLDFVRPLLRAVLSREALEAADGYLFPNWNEIMSPEPSDLVQRFCVPKGLSITANTIRSLWEMKVEWMYQHGSYTCTYAPLLYSFMFPAFYVDQISLEQRTAILSASGHSAEACRESYLIGARSSDAFHVREVSAVAHGLTSSQSSQSPPEPAPAPAPAPSAAPAPAPAPSASATPQRAALPVVYAGILSPAGAPFRPAYMTVGLPISRLHTIGWRHDDKRQGENIKVHFSDVQLGYIGEFIRSDDAAFAEARTFRDTVGDFRVKRFFHRSLI